MQGHPNSDTSPSLVAADILEKADFSSAALLEGLRQSQFEVEAEKSALVRALHDDLGGLLVGAVMDLGWIAQHTGSSTITTDRLARAIASLRSAIDLERSLIEALRPSLLDDVGLFAAIRWHLRSSCNAAGVDYAESYPAEEMAFTPELKIGVFRIVQKSLRHVLSGNVLGHLSLQVEVIDDTLHCRLSSRLLSPRANASATTHAEIATNHCARHLGGALIWLKTLDGDHVEMKLPMRVAAA